MSKSEKQSILEERSVPQYMRIAADVAARIASGEFEEGQRLSGRSLLSSGYKVSPETVRKAMKLLADIGAVRSREGSGTVVLSRKRAEEYLESAVMRKEQLDLKNQLQSLFRQYTELGKQILDVSTRLLEARTTPLPADRELPSYEIRVPEDSDKIGMTIGELQFWHCTGATITAVRRGQKVILSPGPNTALLSGDVLVFVGLPDACQAVEQLLGRGRAEQTLFTLQEQIVRAVHGKEVEAVAKALGARPGDITGVKSLSKGMTNRSFLFFCKDRKYILRIPGEGTGNLINRAQEAEAYRAIAGHGICDDPVYLNPKNGLKVTRFIENARLCDPFREEDLVRCVGLMRKFHGLKLRVNHSFSLFENIEYYESLWDGTPSVYADYEETKAGIFALRPFIEAHAEPFCLTHIDAVPDNFLFYPAGEQGSEDASAEAVPAGGKAQVAAGGESQAADAEKEGGEALQLLDWEYAAMQDPHLDIAMFCSYSEYTKAQADHLIDLYFGFDQQQDASRQKKKQNRKKESAREQDRKKVCPEETRIKIYAYIAVSGLLWSNWCEYKRHMGVEFGAYARMQYDLAKTWQKIVRESLEPACFS